MSMKLLVSLCLIGIFSVDAVSEGSTTRVRTRSRMQTEWFLHHECCFSFTDEDLKSNPMIEVTFKEQMCDYRSNLPGHQCSHGVRVANKKEVVDYCDENDYHGGAIEKNIQKCLAPPEDVREAYEVGFNDQDEVSNHVNQTETQIEVDNQVVVTSKGQLTAKRGMVNGAKGEQNNLPEDASEEDKDAAAQKVTDAEGAEQEARDNEKEAEEKLEEDKDNYKALIDAIDKSKIPLCLGPSNQRFEFKRTCDTQHPHWTDTNNWVWDNAMPHGIDADNAGFFSDDDDKWNMDAHITPTKADLAGAVYQLGDNVIIVTAIDSHGNVNNCKLNILVEDKTNPIIHNCPDDMTYNTAPQGKCSRQVAWEHPHVTDNVPGVLTIVTHETPWTYPLGETVVHWVATDTSGNTAECEFKVTVVDAEPPQLSCPASEDHIFPEEKCAADPEIAFHQDCTFSDNCNGVDLQDVKCDPALPHAMGITHGHAHKVLCGLTDNSDNEAKKTVTDIHVIDETAPLITCPPDREGDDNHVPLGEGPTLTLDDLIDATASDNSCEVEVHCTTPNPGKDLYPGFHEIEWIAIDSSGHEADCAYTIEVRDNTAPEWVDCPAEAHDIRYNTSYGVDYNVAHWTKPTATDNSGEVTYGGAYDTLVSGLAYPLGVTHVMYTATDPSGNEAVCEFDVVIVDVEQPRFRGLEELQARKCEEGKAGVGTLEICGGKGIVVDHHDNSDRANHGVSVKDVNESCCHEGDTCQFHPDSNEQFSICTKQ